METSRVRVTRIAQIPDPIRLERCLRLPELGPRVLFFSGGSALRALSATLKEYTHNSVHLITPFDSGGSSAKLRDAFDMLAVGDLRNRLMALADESVKGNPDIYELFSHRLDEDDDRPRLVTELSAMVRGDHPLVAKVAEPMRRLIRTHLRHFTERMPDDFDLRGASIGNLILAGGYLANEGDIQSVIFLFSKLVEVRGLVRPIVEDNYHLAAHTRGGDVVGQHRITKPKGGPEPIRKLYLVDRQNEPRPVQTKITREVEKLVHRADLICYPPGSFYTSVVANLLPNGVGKAIVNAPCPKIYVPNLGDDVEQSGLTLSESVKAIVDQVRADTSLETPSSEIMNLVLVDVDCQRHTAPQEREKIEAMGIDVLATPLARDDNPKLHDPIRLTEALLSLA